MTEPKTGHGTPGSRLPWGSALAAAFLAAAVPLALTAVGTTALWAIAPGTDHGTWPAALRGAVKLWLLAQGVPVEAPSGTVGVAAWGLGALPIWFLWRAGRRLRYALAERDALFSGPAAGAWAVCALGYAVLGAVACLASGDAGPGRLTRVAAVTGLVAGAVCALGLWTGRRDGLGSGIARLGDLARARVTAGWAAWSEAVARGTGACAAVLAGLGLLGVVVAVLADLPGIARLYGALGAGPAGAVGLTLFQLAWLPTLAVWALGWIAGPGFAVGIGSSFSPVASVSGPLPALPVLAALPEVHGGAWLVVTVLPVLAGLGAGVWLRARGPEPVGDGPDPARSALVPGWPRWADDLALAAGLGLSCGLGLGLAGALTSGAIGPGRLAASGVSGWAALALGVEVFAGAAIALAAVPPLARGLGRAERWSAATLAERLPRARSRR